MWWKCGKIGCNNYPGQQEKNRQAFSADLN